MGMNQLLLSEIPDLERISVWRCYAVLMYADGVSSCPLQWQLRQPQALEEVKPQVTFFPIFLSSCLSLPQRPYRSFLGHFKQITFSLLGIV